jgi:hypothetical protein
MNIPLEVTLTAQGGVVTVPSFPSPPLFPPFPPGTNLDFQIVGAVLKEIRLVVGDPAEPPPDVKLTVLDVNERVLVWPGNTNGNGANIQPPPPPPGGVRISL